MWFPMSVCVQYIFFHICFLDGSLFTLVLFSKIFLPSIQDPPTLLFFMYKCLIDGVCPFKSARAVCSSQHGMASLPLVGYFLHGRQVASKRLLTKSDVMKVHWI